MFTRKTFLVLVCSVLFVVNISMAVMCAKLKSVSAGENHALALMDDNTLWACGDNNLWQLGLGDDVPHVYSLTRVRGEGGNGYSEDIATYDAGWKHSLAADSDGTLWAWGTDDLGQLGNGPYRGNEEFPHKVHGINNVGYLSDTVDIVYVSAGRSGLHSLAVDADGYVYAWGYNGSGECGNGTTGGELHTPVLVLDDDPQTTNVYLGDIVTIIAADAGVHHSIALDDEGHVWEWGQNNVSNIPQKVIGQGGAGYLSNITAISSCGDSMALDSNGNVWTWGSGYPVKVAGGQMGTTYLENIVKIAAGYTRKVVLDTSGNVWEWTSTSLPVKVHDGQMQTESGYLEGIIAIDAGYYDFRLAVDENGYGWAWGENTYGQLGIGNTINQDEPAQMLCAEISESIYLEKTSEYLGSDPCCVRPFIGIGGEDNYLIYDICYGNPVTNENDPNYFGTVYDVNIIDHLPDQADYYAASDGGEYMEAEHAVVWSIGDLAPGETGCVELTVKVNKFACPGSDLVNFCEMTAWYYYACASSSVTVCNWGTEIIYVDKDATGFNNGTNWDNAYTDLQDALAAARNLGADITAIWVAQGIYKPIWDTGEDYTYQDASFELLDDVALFGGFGGVGTYENSIDQRDFSDPNQATVLEGKIGLNDFEAVKYIVTAQGVAGALVDGFTIRGSYSGAGILLDNSDGSIVNCKIKENRNYGIEIKNYSYPDIHNCTFIDNTYRAVYINDHCWPEVAFCIFDGNNTTGDGINQTNYSVVVVENSTFMNHTDYGIYTNSGTLEVSNSSFDDNNNNGIDISLCTLSMENCSIKGSQNGIRAYNNSDLDITHCVLENNNKNGLYTGNGCDLNLSNSLIRSNGEDGIELNDNLVTTIKNNWIHNNGISQSAYYGGAGISFKNQSSVPLVRNNTIYDNWTYGIESSQYGADPAIINCIIYGNDSADLYRPNGSFNNVNYCCLQNAHSGAGNITDDPDFINPADPYDLHIAQTSPCKDTGDPSGSYDQETDIDGEARVIDGRVDMGADEYFWSRADFDTSGRVNLIDYAILAAAWLSEADDNNYNETCDLEDDNTIDVKDLALFVEDWLWKVGFSFGQQQMFMGSGGDNENDFLAASLSLGTFSSTAAPPAAENIDSLMLLTPQESLNAQPSRLKDRSRKFYDINPDETITARKKETLSREVNISEILKWLDEVWISGDLKDVMAEQEYLGFRESIEKSR